MPRDRISYSRGFPSGAPLVMVRGGATSDRGIKDFLRSQGFRHDKRLYAWTHYLNGPEFIDVLVILRDTFGCEIVPKANMDANYILTLPEPEDDDDEGDD